jgi:hypothetical protein
MKRKNKNVCSQSVVTRKIDNDTFNSSWKFLEFDGLIQDFSSCWNMFFAYSTMSCIKSILKEERYLHLPEKR